MLLQQIKLFLFILSIVFSLRYVVEFFTKYREENPKPMTIDKTSKIFLYFAVSYFLTYLISLSHV